AGLATALSLGAEAVWVGTRFVCSEESGSSMEHKMSIINSTYDDTVRTLDYSGRPMRVIKNPYQKSWDEDRPKLRDNLLKNGITPAKQDEEKDPFIVKHKGYVLYLFF